ncbi:AAA family ATPase [bacterium]|nr:AAA family ATPase [bacterium]
MFQEKALAILKSGRNVFLTGPAGSGKTYTLNAFIQYLREHGVRVAVTASTGIAATHMKGTTIHSWTGIGIKDDMSHGDMRALRAKSYLLKAMEKTHVLIIDEISMLHRKQLDLINRVLRYMRNNPAPFGGMQVVFAGDFFQLPPVSKSEETNREKFAFMSQAWVDAAPVICYLAEQHRQSGDTLNTILNELRQRELNEFSVQALMERQNPETPLQNPTRLYTHNIDVDTINRQELDQLEGDSEVFIAKTTGNKKILAAMERSLIVQQTVELKVGAKVMFLKNDHERGVMNGTLGEVIDFDAETGLPVVKLNDGKVLIAEHAEWSMEDEGGKTLASFKQVPLRLAWAITVHKSQGMTLDEAEVDLTKTFERGQGYVALSRLRDIEGLHLIGINRMALEVDNLASKADERFIELSAEADRALSMEELEAQFEDNLLQKGGSLKKVKIEKEQDKSSTYDKTLELLEQEKSLKEIIKIRELTEPTVLRHISVLVKRDPKNLPMHLKPDEKIIKAISKVLPEAGEEDKTDKGEVKLSWLFGKLKGKYDFNQLRLAILYT